MTARRDKVANNSRLLAQMFIDIFKKRLSFFYWKTASSRDKKSRILKIREFWKNGNRYTKNQNRGDTDIYIYTHLQKEPNILDFER